MATALDKEYMAQVRQQVQQQVINQRERTAALGRGVSLRGRKLRGAGDMSGYGIAAYTSDQAPSSGGGGGSGGGTTPPPPTNPPTTKKKKRKKVPVPAPAPTPKKKRRRTAPAPTPKKKVVVPHQVEPAYPKKATTKKATTRAKATTTKKRRRRKKATTTIRYANKARNLL